MYLKRNISLFSMCSIFILGFLFLLTPGYAADLPGMYQILPDKASTHQKGKVKLTVFVDFFCGHCFHFDTEDAVKLKQTFREKITIEYVGFPLGEDSYKPIEAYELAKDAGKGEQVMEAIFEAIHVLKKDGADIGVLTDITGRAGMDKSKTRDALENSSKKKKVQDNAELGKSYKVRGTPTIIIDGNIKVVGNSYDNINKIAAGILANE